MRAPVPRDAASPAVISRAPRRRVAEHRERPAAQHAPHRLAVDVAEPRGGGDRRLGPFVRRLRLAPALVHDRHLRARGREAVGAARVARQLERARRPRQRAVGPPEEPERQPGPVVAGDARVVAERRRERRVAARRAAGLEQLDAAVGVLQRARERALVEQVAGEQLGRLELVLGVAARRELLALLRHVVRARELAAQLVQRREREQDGDERLVVGQPRREAASAQQRVLGLGRRPAAGRDERLAERRQQLDLRARALGARLERRGGVERSAQVADALVCALRPNARSAASRSQRTARSGSRPARKWKPSSEAIAVAARP